MNLSSSIITDFFKWKLCNTIVKVDTSITFLDTNDNDAKKAASIGITNGVGSNNFGPNRLITREEMATLLMRTIKLGGVSLNEGQVNTFLDDSKMSFWSKASIYMGRLYNLFQGKGANLFAPTDTVTVEEILVIINKSVNITPVKNFIQSSNIDFVFPVNLNKKWNFFTYNLIGDNRAGHNGIDYQALDINLNAGNQLEVDEVVHAVQDGKIVMVEKTNGNITIEHKTPLHLEFGGISKTITLWYSNYAHLNDVSQFQVGQDIYINQPLAKVSNTGVGDKSSTENSHLHFSLTTRIPSGSFFIKDTSTHYYECMKELYESYTISLLWIPSVSKLAYQNGELATNDAISNFVFNQNYIVNKITTKNRMTLPLSNLKTWTESIY